MSEVPLYGGRVGSNKALSMIPESGGRRRDMLETGGYFDLEGYNILNPTVAGIAV